jgi:hypothetical protein
MAEYEKKAREQLRKNGCHFVRRGKGDHDIWYRHLFIHASIISLFHLDVKLCGVALRMAMLRKVQNSKKASEGSWYKGSCLTNRCSAR